jgi:hypothetical protein
VRIDEQAIGKTKLATKLREKPDEEYPMVILTGKTKGSWCWILEGLFHLLLES